MTLFPKRGDNAATAPQGFFYRGRKMSKIINYFKDIRSEFFQITWPARAVAIRLTLVVVVFSAVVAAFLGLVDYGFGEAIRKFILS